MKYDLENINCKEMFSDIENAINILEDRRIRWRSFKQSNLGVFLTSKSYENVGVWNDTKIDDLISNNPHFNFRAFLTVGKNNDPQILRLEPANFKTFKSEISVFKKNTLSFSSCVLINGKIENETVPIIEDKGKLDVPLRQLAGMSKQEKSFYTKTILENAQFALDVAWEDYFHWKIQVKMPEWEKTVEFYINPSDIKSVFKMRDISEGENRRKALKHLVSSHKRKNKSGDEIEIAKYIRGREKFSQNGYILNIIPSQDILDTIGDKKRCLTM